MTLQAKQISMVIIESNITEDLCSHITEFGDHRAHRNNRIAHSNCCSQAYKVSRRQEQEAKRVEFWHFLTTEINSRCRTFCLLHSCWAQGLYVVLRCD